MAANRRCIGGGSGGGGRGSSSGDQILRFLFGAHSSQADRRPQKDSAKSNKSALSAAAAAGAASQFHPPGYSARAVSPTRGPLTAAAAAPLSALGSRRKWPLAREVGQHLPGAGKPCLLITIRAVVAPTGWWRTTLGTKPWLVLRAIRLGWFAFGGSCLRAPILHHAK